MALSRNFTPTAVFTLAKVKIFVDGAEFKTNHEMLFWIWSSTLAEGTSSYTIKFLFGAIPMKLLPTKELRKLANERMVDVIRWDLETLLTGKFPHHDHLGQPFLDARRARKAGALIADGWRLAFDAWIGDWKERTLSHNFVGKNYLSQCVCDACGAIQIFQKTPERVRHLTYCNFSADAPWQFTRVTHEVYLQKTRASELTPWMAIPGFRKERVQWEPMHVILLGTGKDVAASVLCDVAACLHSFIFYSPIARTFKEVQRSG